MEKLAKAGPLILLRERTEEGPVINFIVLSGGRVLQVFSLHQRHLIGRREAIEILSEFVDELRAGEEA